MISCRVLFDEKNDPLSPKEISRAITKFGESYLDTISEIIQHSRVLDKDGKVFIKCASRILRGFQMTRSGVFHKNLDETLSECWHTIGKTLIEINNSILISGISRDRYLLEVSEAERKRLISEIWQMTKALLPLTMSDYSSGLVGASKILFSVLPEIVLPVDNVQWKKLFKTVDLGDVIRFMVEDIRKWEQVSGQQFNLLDHSNRLTTLPSVYNVVAMKARPLKINE